MTVSAGATLRPLQLGEILDRAVHLYRRNFLQYVGIVAVVQVPIALIQILISLTAFGNTFTRLGDILSNPAAAPASPFAVLGPSYFIGASLNTLVSILGFIMLQGVATAALTAAVAGSYLGRPPASIRDAYRSVKEKWLPVVGALLLAIVLAIALGIWWLIPCFGWFTGGGMLLFLWYVIVPMLAPIIILEGGSPTVAWRRAWTLARRRFWWVLGFALILYLFNLLVVAGPATLVTVGGQFLSGNPLEITSERFTVQTIVQSFALLITGLFYLPLQVASMTLLYLDLRVRTEGLDLTLAAESLPLPQVAPEEVMADTTVAFREPLLRGESILAGEPLVRGVDWRNFFILTICSILLVVALYGLIFVLALALISALGPL